MFQLCILFAKILNVFRQGEWIQFRKSILLTILSVISNSIIMVATLSLTSANIILPEKPSDSVTYVVDIPPNQAMLTSYLLRFSGFITTIVIVLQVVEVMFHLASLVKRTTRTRFIPQRYR